jgi:IS5 family transposase
MEFQNNYNIPLNDLKDLITIMYVIIDDLYNESVPDKIKYRLHKNKAVMSDSEIITVSVIGELMSIDSENAWIRYVKKNLTDLFPNMCERSRFNRIRRKLSEVIDRIRQRLGTKLDFTDDVYRITDSFPLQVCEFGRARFCKSFKVEGADYGYCASKKKTYFGFKVHQLCTLNGYVTDFTVTPASTDDRDAVWELTEGYGRHIKLLGDKGYIGTEFAQDLLNENDVLMVTLKRDNSKNPDPKAIRQLIFKLRRRIETSVSQLAGQFNAERVKAKSLLGLLTRMQSKILAFNLCFAVNWLIGKHDNIACIKSLVF